MQRLEKCSEDGAVLGCLKGISARPVRHVCTPIHPTPTSKPDTVFLGCRVHLDSHFAWCDVGCLLVREHGLGIGGGRGSCTEVIDSRQCVFVIVPRWRQGRYSIA